MNQRSLFIVSLVASVFLILPQAVRAESISDFNTRIQINRDSSLKITETIIYDYEGASRHGIYRDIPVSYDARGGRYALRISAVSVNDENGSAVPFSESSEGIYERIKIGDPNVLVTGVKTYVIAYTVDRALNYFSDHDELYWNATGNEWLVPVRNAEALVVLPRNAAESDLTVECYFGNLSSQLTCQKASFSQSQNGVVFEQSELAASQGLTVVVGFPVAWVVKPVWWREFLNTLVDNWILFLPLVVFGVMFYLWYSRGRDPKISGPVVAEYEAPEGLSAAEVGAIYDSRADNKDITAAIIELAVKGDIKIRKTKRDGLVFKSDDWQLVRLKTEDAALSDFEKELMKRLFSYDEALAEPAAAVNLLPVERAVSLFRLKDKFYKDQQELKKRLYESLVLHGFYLRSPQKVLGAYVGGGVVVAFLGVWLGGLFGGYTVLALVASAVIIIAFGIFMPAKTMKGAEVKRRILGLREYLKIAEADRLKFHNAPAKTPERFEKLLPYAVALSVEKEWAAQFEGIFNQSPRWYEDGSGGMFNSVMFVSALNHFSATANTNLSSAPRSAAGGSSGFSGGFSGGGFGGGGGGSW
ncbi:MAG: DUF2207 domain-containing protein [Patescibacteria group bacterium]|nr:DUF2207 domain-containing protein [Patescibacteria group bacterium]